MGKALKAIGFNMRRMTAEFAIGSEIPETDPRLEDWAKRGLAVTDKQLAHDAHAQAVLKLAEADTALARSVKAAQVSDASTRDKHAKSAAHLREQAAKLLEKHEEVAQKAVQEAAKSLDPNDLPEALDNLNTVRTEKTENAQALADQQAQVEAEKQAEIDQKERAKEQTEAAAKLAEQKQAELAVPKGDDKPAEKPADKPAEKPAPKTTTKPGDKN